MSINFKQIRWKNFLSTGNEWTEINLNDTSTTLIIGENGAGKSTITDAITYALYNKPFRKINKPQLVNSINNKLCRVEIEFDINNESYTVKRGMKPNLFEIYKEGKLLNQDAASKDYQEFLEKKILNLNYKSFCQVVILGSASFVPFMQLSAQNRREIIENLLDLQIFTTMNNLLKNKITDNNKNILDNEYKYELTTEKIKLQEKHLLGISENYQQQLNSYKERIAINENKLESEKKYALELKDKIQELKTSLSDEHIIKDKIKKLQDYEYQIKNKISNLEKDISFFEKHKDCPTCKQSINDDFKSDQIVSKQNEIEQIKKGLSKLNDELNKLNDKKESFNIINKQIVDFNTELHVRINTIKNIENSIKEIQSDIKQLEEKNTQLIQDDESMKLLENELENIGEEKKNLLSIRDMCQFSSVLLKDTGIKAKIISQYVPVINKLINKYLTDMEFSVHFEIDENFNETIKSRYRDVFSYTSFSEGEKMRINLAILFTWRAIAKARNSASTNLLILDEVFDGSLDSNGTEEFMKIIKNITNDTNTFIISHKTDQMLDKFDKVLKFKKKNNFSELTKGV